MTTPDVSEKPSAPIASTPRTGSAATCVWSSGHGGKKSPIELCGKPAKWEKTVYRRGNAFGSKWQLCDYHKNLLLDSFNEKTKAAEVLTWTPIMRQNGPS